MSHNIFGTDGVRGRANEGLITPDSAMRLAVAVTSYYQRKCHSKEADYKFTVVIGKDTRLSGYMLEPALTSGFIAAGANVILLGPIPTPGVAYMTKSLRANLGVVISASHNPYHDNGIKFFNADGFKVTMEDEDGISNAYWQPLTLTKTEFMGKAWRLDDAAGRYVEFTKGSFPKELNLSGMKIVVDTANGAAYKVAPQVLWEFGADIIKIGNTPDGLNINDGYGVMDTSRLQEEVLKHKACIGIAFDGDADRVAIVDETGELIDGDYLISTIATSWLNSGRLRGNAVVATIMTNLAMERYLDSIGINLVRTDVGDKHVMQKMIEIGANVGGEQSGHIITGDYSTTGDGIVSALQILAYLKSMGVQASTIKKLYTPCPSIIKNIPLDLSCSLDKYREAGERIVGHAGRIIVRKSGTEQFVRVLIEATSTDLVNAAATAVCNL
ncbi:MAG: phosphoglucosamine mutase [Holosporales bacterium]|jgi:phosphoglucosamine mutase|nr:phosphoglucosamine mutase [Holosporales bacterium]